MRNYPRLFSDLGIRRNRMNVDFWNDKRPIPESVTQDFLPGYTKVCTVRQTYPFEANWICAVPEKGGEYLVIGVQRRLEDYSRIVKEGFLRDLLGHDSKK